MGVLPRITESERGETHVGATNSAAENSEITVELWAAPLPLPLAALAWHYWFVVSCPETGGKRTRFEVWQRRNAGGVSAGHVHRGLMSPENGVGYGRSARYARWTGEAARALTEVLLECFESYPYRDRYAAWPGPNSNTFVRWVLDEAACRHPELAGEVCSVLDPRAVGRDFLGRFGAGCRRLSGGNGWQIASPLMGLRFWRRNSGAACSCGVAPAGQEAAAPGRVWFVEASLLGLTLLGVEAAGNQMSLLTAFGRIPLTTLPSVGEFLWRQGVSKSPSGSFVATGGEGGAVVASRPQ